MALREIEQHRVKRIVGAFCQSRIPKDDLRTQAILLYEVDGDDVTLIQKTLVQGVWADVPVAKIRYNSEKLAWQLCWNDGRAMEGVHHRTHFQPSGYCR